MSRSEPRIAPSEQAIQVTQQTENALLGSVLRWPAVLDDVIPLLPRPDYFAQDAAQKCWTVFLDLHGRKPIDLVTVADELHTRGWLADCGGHAHLAALWDAMPTGGNAVYYARSVREGHLRRSLGHLGAEILREVAEPSRPVEMALAGFEGRLLGLSDLGVEGESVPLSRAVSEALDRIDRRIAGEPLGLPTGWVDLDRILAAIPPGDLVLVGARPSHGKTAWGLGLARHLAVSENVPVLVVSLEQSREQLTERLLAAQGSVDGNRIRKGTLTPREIDAIQKASVALRKAPLHIDHARGQTASRIVANVRRAVRAHGIQCVIVDYIQLVEPDTKKGDRQKNRYEEVGRAAKRLRDLAGELSIPIVAMAQVGRDADGREPRLSDFRESGDLENHADTALLLYRAIDPKGDEPTSLVDVIVAKQRNGPIGRCTLIYHRPYVRFDSYASDGPNFSV